MERERFLRKFWSFVFHEGDFSTFRLRKDSLETGQIVAAGTHPRIAWQYFLLRRGAWNSFQLPEEFVLRQLRQKVHQLLLHFHRYRYHFHRLTAQRWWHFLYRDVLSERISIFWIVEWCMWFCLSCLTRLFYLRWWGMWVWSRDLFLLRRHLWRVLSYSGRDDLMAVCVLLALTYMLSFL